MDAKAFFDQVRAAFPGALHDQSHVDGFNAVLAAVAAWPDIRWQAYAIATAWHETDFTMQPVREAFWETEDWRRKHLRYYPWYGRGFVQLTHLANYARADRELGLVGALVRDLDKALDPDLAGQIMVRGMTDGWSTTKKLSDYIHGTTCDYRQCRRIINGLDKAAAIAAYADKFEACLRAAQ